MGPAVAALVSILPALISSGVKLGTTYAQKEMLKNMKAKGPSEPAGPGMAMLAQGSMREADALEGLQDKLEVDAERAKAESLDVPEELR